MTRAAMGRAFKAGRTLLLIGLARSRVNAQVPGASNAARSADSASIATLEQRIETALVKRDVPFLDSVYAPTFRFKHSTGQLETREERMVDLRRPIAPNATGRVLERTVDSLDVEVHGDIALTTGRIHIRSTSANPHWQDYTIRYVRLYARTTASGGRWQLVTHHSTSDAQGPPPPLRPR